MSRIVCSWLARPSRSEVSRFVVSLCAPLPLPAFSSSSLVQGLGQRDRIASWLAGFSPGLGEELLLEEELGALGSLEVASELPGLGGRRL